MCFALIGPIDNDDDGGGELPYVDHVPLNEGAVGKILLEQGVPQGDVISPYIFIVAVEILLIKITYTKNLTGITFGSVEGRSETFADDTTIYLERTSENLRNAVKYLKDFSEISGLQCNLDKTSVIPIGQEMDRMT